MPVLIRSFLAGLLAAWFALLPAAQAADNVTVAFFNLRNYLSMSRRDDDGGPAELRPKPEKEIEAVLKVILSIKPDILGVCEMGTREDFEDLAARLKKAGLEFTASHYLEADDDRHLAIYSRFPIAARNTVKNLTYDLNGTAAQVRRGFLDVSVEINPDYRLRLIGAHLKSKRPVPEGEALVRRHEAELLRAHLEEIMDAAPETNLLVFGDFNDTRNEPAISEIRGRRNSATHLEDLPLEDSGGDRWTQYWSTADLYSRFDYFFANKAVRPEVLLDESYVFRAGYWQDASDHRAIVVVLSAENK